MIIVETNSIKLFVPFIYQKYGNLLNLLIFYDYLPNLTFNQES